MTDNQEQGEPKKKWEGQIDNDEFFESLKQEQRSDSEHTGEPVAWMMHNSSGDEISITESNLRHHQPAFVQDLWKDSTPLYTTPQQRTWVGLTDEDRQAAFESMPDMLDGFLKKWGWLHFSKALEAKLKEKNGG